uniref:Serpin domain-containing protein n=1 Tax=Amblyomma maculatum TaxID=34609 RepID=G3MLS9_AMBMU
MKYFIFISCLWALCAAQDEQKVAHANNEFGFRLLQKIPASSEVNIFFSPYSVSTALTMAYAGARGETQHELYESLAYAAVGLAPDHVYNAQAQHTQVLKSPSSSTLLVANTAVVQEGYNILGEYLNILKLSFDAEASVANLADEQSLSNINEWVKNHTGGKFEKLLSEPLSTDAKLVLLNAIYFKGIWNTPFHSTSTFKAPFFNAGTEQVEVDMMHGQITAGYARDDDTNADIVDLPYAGLDYSMTIVRPRDRTGVDALRNTLTWPVFRRLLSQLTETVVNVELPKFTIEGEYKLKRPLSLLGVSKAFQEDQADFSGISGFRDLFVYDVIHKAVVEVNEEGSQAAGATGVIFHTESAVRGTPFVVNHPFLFFIRNRQTGDVLFVGQVNHL